MTAETAALLIADHAEKITADLPASQRLDAIKSAIAKLREMHEEIMNKAASFVDERGPRRFSDKEKLEYVKLDVSVLLSSEYFTK